MELGESEVWNMLNGGGGKSCLVMVSHRKWEKVGGLEVYADEVKGVGGKGREIEGCW